MTTQTNYPPLPTWTAYDEAVQTLQTLTNDLREAHLALDALRGGDRLAEKADSEARAAALRSGKADPGPKQVTKWKADLESAKDKVMVLETAVAQQQQAVEALLTDERVQAREAADAGLEDARERYRAALAEIVAARERFHLARLVQGWVAAPDRRRWKQSAAPGLTLPGFVQPNGEPISAQKALEAFAAETDPVEPPRETARYVQRNSYDEIAQETTRRFVGVDQQGRDFSGNQVV